MKKNLGQILTILSFVVGAAVWIYSVIVALKLAGLIWMIVGIVLAGVGVVFVALVSSVISGAYDTTAMIGAGAIVVFILRIVGASLLQEKEQ